MELSNYKFRGARALVLLHEYHLRSFYKTWIEANSLGVKLPQIHNPDYNSMHTLLVHVLKWAGNYMIEMCSLLKLGDPQISQVPSSEEIEKKAEEYLNHILERWRIPLSLVEADRFDLVFGDHTILDRLEHAVLHPYRHEFQLNELLNNSFLTDRIKEVSDRKIQIK